MVAQRDNFRPTGKGHLIQISACGSSIPLSAGDSPLPITSKLAIRLAIKYHKVREWISEDVARAGLYSERRDWLLISPWYGVGSSNIAHGVQFISLINHIMWL